MRIHHHISYRELQKGSTLLAVFWVMAVMGMAVVASMRVVSYQVDVVDSQLGGIEAAQFAERGIAVATHRSTQRWDPILRQTFEGGGFEAKIISEAARFDINYILRDQNESDRKPLLRAIFDYWGIDDGDGDLIADALVDWVDRNELEENNGAEADYYENLGLEGYPFNREFYSLDEMRLVRGMDIVEAAEPEWRNWFTVWSNSGLDINAADVELIEVALATDRESARQIVIKADGPDGVRFTEDDEQVSTSEALSFAGGFIDQETLGARITAGGGGGQSQGGGQGQGGQVMRIESVGFVGDVRRKIILIVNSMSSLQIFDRRIEFVQ